MAKRQTDNQVLYIVDIDEMEPPEATRKGRSTPLDWGRLRTVHDISTNGVMYTSRRDSIKAMPDGFAILGVYYEIITTYGVGRIAPLRGWILDHRLRAASMGQIAVVIGCPNPSLVKRAVRVLVDVGLLMWTECPSFKEAIKSDLIILPDGRLGSKYTRQPTNPTTPTGAEGEAKDRKPAKPTTPPRADGKAKDQKPANSTTPPGAEGSNAGDVQRRLPGAAGGEAPGGGVPPGGRPAAGGRPVGLPTGDERPETVHGETDTRDGTASAAPSPFPDPGDGLTAHLKPGPDTAPAAAGAAPPALPSPTRTRQTGDCHAPQSTPEAFTCLQGDASTADGLSSQPQAQAPQTRSAPVSEPAHPTETDQGGSKRTRLPALDQSWHAEDFAQQVFARLYPSPAVIVEQGRRAKKRQGPEEFARTEIACFERGFYQALVGMDQIQAVRLIERCLREADAAPRKKGKRPGTYGQYWRWWFGVDILAKSRRDRPGRSGPP